MIRCLLALRVWQLLACTMVCGVFVLHCAPAYSADDEPQARLIVKWKTMRGRTQAVNAADNALRAAVGVGLARHRQLIDRMEAVELEQPLPRSEFAAALAKLNAQPDIEYAVADERRFAHALPDDPYFPAPNLLDPSRSGQWYLQNGEVAAINAQAAWDLSTGGSSGSGVIVAVLDTGVRFDHPDLAGKLLPGYDFVSCDQSNCSGVGVTYYTANDGNGWDNNPSDPGDWISQTDLNNHPSVFPSSRCSVGNSTWHGTRVAGIVGAATNNSIGIAGTGYNARVLPVRVLGKCGGFDSDIIAGMLWAAGIAVPGAPANPNPAKIINLSLGGSGACPQNYIDAIAPIKAAGVSIVASAGNEGGPIDTPANCSGVIGVAGVRNVGTKVGYSSLGPEATVAAPAGNCGSQSGCSFPIDSTTNLGITTPAAYSQSDSSSYYTNQGINNSDPPGSPNLGTSFSSPIVSGTLALMLGRNPNLSPAVLRTRLQASAKSFPNTAALTCHAPSSSDPQNYECNCTTATCGAGLVDAASAVADADPPIVIYIRGANATKPNGTVQLDASGSTLNDSTSTYTWSVTGGAVLSTTNGPTTTVTAPSTTGSFDATLMVSDTAGHSDSHTHTITVYGPPTVVVSGVTSMIAGTTTTLDASGSSAQDGGYLTYQWFVLSGGATLSGSNQATVNVTAPNVNGTVSLRVAVTDDIGNTTTQDYSISVTGATGANSSGNGLSSSASSSSGGGGGNIGWLLLTALNGLVGIRRHIKTQR